MTRELLSFPGLGPMNPQATLLPTSRKKVVIAGVGGIGCHLAKRIRKELRIAVKAVLINTDERSFGADTADVEVSLQTGGRGTGSRSAQGAALAQQRIQAIQAGIGDADVVVIIAALGGGTGSGATPVVTGAALAAGAIPILVVTTPAESDSPRCHQNAREALHRLSPLASTLIRRQLELATDCPDDDDHGFNCQSALQAAEKWIATVVREIVAPWTGKFGPISTNDAADLESWLRQKGQVHWASATARGTDRAATACTEALHSLREESRENGGARATLCVISAREAPQDGDVETVLEMIPASLGPNRLLSIFAVMDERIVDESIRVTVISKAPRRRDILTVVPEST